MILPQKHIKMSESIFGCLCQVILGLVIIPIFQTLKNCTLFATALRLLARSSYKVRAFRTL